MASIQVTNWAEIGQQLRSLKNDRQNRYFHPYNWLDPQDNFLKSVEPISDEFFGVKVYSILIIGKNYGWQTEDDFVWPPNQEFVNSQQNIIQRFPNFTKYIVDIYMDFILVNRVMEATPSSKFRDQMEQLEEQIIQFCNEMTDYGFNYQGRIESEVDYTFFQTSIDNFYNNNY